jgi:hypothetical protein
MFFRANARTGRLIGVVLAASLFCTLIGCQKTPPPTGEVSGKLTYKGEPVPMGRINFVTEDGRAASGEIKNGTYKVPAAPIGLVKIEIVGTGGAGNPNNPRSVEVPKGHGGEAQLEVARRMGANPPASVPTYQPPKGMTIPQKYGNTNTSGLTYEVVVGPQNHDIELKP